MINLVLHFALAFLQILLWKCIALQTSAGLGAILNFMPVIPINVASLSSLVGASLARSICESHLFSQ